LATYFRTSHLEPTWRLLQNESTGIDDDDDDDGTKREADDEQKGG
jgi:hypothetical protein